MIYHITTKAQWQAAQKVGAYTADSLAAEGFIHCSDLAQVADSANRFFKGQKNLLLLKIDTDKLSSPLKYEDLYMTGLEFPHIFGPINLSAVVKVIPYTADAEGNFKTPVE